MKFQIVFFFLILAAVSLVSCIKEHGHRANDDWDDLPESGYYEWLGNTVFEAGTNKPLDSLVLTRTPQQAGFTAGYKFVFEPQTLARVELIVNGQVISSKYVRTVERELTSSFCTLRDNAEQVACCYSYYFGGSEYRRKHFILRNTNQFYVQTLDFGEGLPFFKKVN
ncbi:MAG: hypothetical protein RL092_1188 [Bacteroidota bacterium]|jgi:hypothetical protein